MCDSYEPYSIFLLAYLSVTERRRTWSCCKLGKRHVEVEIFVDQVVQDEGAVRRRRQRHADIGHGSREPFSRLAPKSVRDREPGACRVRRYRWHWIEKPAPRCASAARRARRAHVESSSYARTAAPGSEVTSRRSRLPKSSIASATCTMSTPFPTASRGSRRRAAACSFVQAKKSSSWVEMSEVRVIVEPWEAGEKTKLAYSPRRVSRYPVGASARRASVSPCRYAPPLHTTPRPSGRLSARSSAPVRSPRSTPQRAKRMRSLIGSAPTRRRSSLRQTGDPRHLHGNQAAGGGAHSNCDYMTVAAAAGRGVARALCAHSRARPSSRLNRSLLVLT